jgi:hypothetical protein
MVFLPTKKNLIHAKNAWNWLELEIKSVPIHRILGKKQIQHGKSGIE